MGETGYNGQLISLAGVKGTPGIGRLVNSENKNAAVGNAVLLPGNVKRIAALIQVTQPTSEGGVHILFQGEAGLNKPICQLHQWDILQIDDNFPWTGPVLFSDTSATPNVTVSEISVQ